MNSEAKENKVFAEWFDEWVAKANNHSASQPLKPANSADPTKRPTESYPAGVVRAPVGSPRDRDGNHQ